MSTSDSKQNLSDATGANSEISPTDLGAAVGAGRAFLAFLSKGIALYQVHTTSKGIQPQNLAESLRAVDTEAARAAESGYLTAIGLALGSVDNGALDLGASFDAAQNKAFEAVLSPLLRAGNFEGVAQLTHTFVTDNGFIRIFDIHWGLCVELVQKACAIEGNPRAWSMSRQAVLDCIPAAVEKAALVAQKTVVM